MKNMATGIALSLFAAITLTSFSYAQSMDCGMDKKGRAEMVMSYTRTEVDLRLAMRKLWEDHIVYTRNYIISALADLKDVDAVAQRLLDNQEDIGNAIKPYYGEGAGDKLAALLRDHILIATQVVKAAKENNSKELAEAQKKWNANAEDIAVFLSGANPHWFKKDMAEMLAKHLEFTTGEVVSRLKEDWVSDIDYYDRGHVHMLMFADMLVDGLHQQFPDRFKK